MLKNKLAVFSVGIIVFALAIGGIMLFNSGLGIPNPFSPANIESSRQVRNLDDPITRDTDGDNLSDLVETNSSYAQQFGLNPYAIDIIAKCYVRDLSSYTNTTNVLNRLKDDLKDKIEFINLDNSSGVNLHVDGPCIDIPQEMDFSGVEYYDPERKDIDAASIQGTSLGQYLDQVAGPVDQRVHLQIIFTSFDASRNEYGIVGFPITDNRQIVVSPTSDDAMVAITIGHVLGHLINLDHSNEINSVMSEPGGPVYYDSEWATRLEELDQKSELLFDY